MSSLFLFGAGAALDGNGNVVWLRAPPSDDSRAELQVIANGASAEEEAYRKLRDFFGDQDFVLRTNAIFRRLGAEFEMVGKSEYVEVKRS